MRRLYNLLGVASLIVWYGWGLSQDIPVFIQRFYTLDASGHISALFILQALAQAASIAFISFLIVLLIVRDAPRAQTRGFAPYAAALFGTFATTSFFFLSSATIPTPLLVLATLCIVTGLGLSIYALIYLGRSFAILPSARSLVTDGPYRFVRHPLYLFEEIAVMGVMIQFVQPWALLILAVHFSAQLARMHYEERALAEAFHAYVVYTKQTARLIPGVY